MGKYNKYKTGNIISIYYLWVLKETKYGIIGNRHSSSNSSSIITPNFHAFIIYNAITNP